MKKVKRTDEEGGKSMCSLHVLIAVGGASVLTKKYLALAIMN